MAKQKKDTQASVADNTSLDVARKAIAKKYGDGIITTLGEAKKDKIHTFPSGSLSLDLAMGLGGFARGRIYEIYGSPSSGKTTLSMSLIAQIQKLGHRAVFCDAEHSASPHLFEAMGVDIDNLDLVKAYDGDDNLEIMATLIKTGQYRIAVIDSVSALIPKNESEAEMADQFMGGHARLMSKAMRKLSPIADKCDTLIILINQTRMKIGGYGNPVITTGGEAITFYCSGRILVSGGSPSTRITDPLSGETAGHMTKFEVVKNKLAIPLKTANIPLFYGRGYDLHWECLNMAIDAGVIDRSGAWYKYNGESFAQGEANAVIKLRENEEMYREVREQVIERTGLDVQYKLFQEGYVSE